MAMVRQRWQTLLTGLSRLVDDPRWARWLVLAGVLAGIALRLVFSWNTHFGGDLGISYALAQDIAHGRNFPLIGAQASWGGNAPFPGYFYLIALPLLLSDSVHLFVSWGALLCALGLIPFALLLWERYGPRSAVFGAWFAAAAPWGVLFGDSPWSPGLALPCAALELYATHRVIAGERSRWAAVVPLAFALHAHVYPNLPAMLLACLAMVLIVRPRVAWGWFALGTAAAAATIVPSLLHLAAQTAPPLVAIDRSYERVDSLGLLVNAAYATFAFATAETAHWMDLGFWWGFDILSWVRNLPGSLQRSYGDRLGVYVVANVVLTAACWGWAATLWVRGLVRRRGRGWDPLAVAGIVAALGSLVLLGLLHKPYQPRYNAVVFWLALLPPVLLAARPRRGGALLWLALLAALPNNVYVARHYYRSVVPPYGVASTVEIIDRILATEQGRPFELSYPVRRISRATDTIARATRGAQWKMVRRAAYKYVALPRKLDSRQRRLFAQAQGKVWKLEAGGWLVRVPGSRPERSRPAGVRRPPRPRPRPTAPATPATPTAPRPGGGPPGAAG